MFINQFDNNKKNTRMKNTKKTLKYQLNKFYFNG